MPTSEHQMAQEANTLGSMQSILTQMNRTIPVNRGAQALMHSAKELMESAVQIEEKQFKLRHQITDG